MHLVLDHVFAWPWSREQDPRNGPDLHFWALFCRGGFSRVFRGRKVETGQPVAIKKTGRENEGMWSVEVDALRRLQHPNVMSLVDWFEIDKDILIVMPLAEGGDLFDRIVDRGMSEGSAAKVTMQLLESVAYIHSMGVVHRDIKPENCVFASSDSNSPHYDKVMLCDFGLCAITDRPEQVYVDSLVELYGTRHFSAPELINVGLAKSGRTS